MSFQMILLLPSVVIPIEVTVVSVGGLNKPKLVALSHVLALVAMVLSTVSVDRSLPAGLIEYVTEEGHFTPLAINLKVIESFENGAGRALALA